MPIYDYVCGACGQRTEVIHGIAAPSPQFCPACGVEGQLRKALVAPTVHFKGSGWAKKDRSTSTRAASKLDGDGAAPAAVASDGADKAGAARGAEKGAPGEGSKAASTGADSPVPSAGAGGEAGKGSSKAAGAGVD